MADPILNLYTKNAYVHVSMWPSLGLCLIYNVKIGYKFPRCVTKYV